MADHTSRAEAISKLGEMIKDINIAMFSTAEGDGTIRSRPMATQRVAFTGELWFFTGASSAKVDEIQRDQHVNLSYADPDDNRYVSVSGTASLVRDPAKIKELWNPILKAWFPKGQDDPDIALLRVDVQEAEYWDSPSSKMVQIVGFIKAIATGTPANGGENEKLAL
ncbi:MAG: pyridoxamine 5'-phosphate oxidase family protein [Roseiflexaceae bacterium]|nr:pyridoxamine 5'-phosphate oxidase family protein [Roseiflexaceae bacterium]